MKIIIDKLYIVQMGKEKNKYPHKHHAVQLVIPLDIIIVNGKQLRYSVIINSNTEHFVNSNKGAVSILLEQSKIVGE